MMLPSHLLASLLVGLVLSQLRRFRPRDWFLAIGFGVAIDLDHLLQLRSFLLAHGGLGRMDASTVVHWGGSWQGFMHTPLALVLVIPAVLIFRSVVPAAFWLLHMFQDFVIARHYVVFGSPTEWAVDVALLAGVLGLLALDRWRHGSGAPLHLHAASLVGWTRPARAAEPPASAEPAQN